MTYKNWQRRSTVFAHPLGTFTIIELGILRKLENAIQTKEGYSEICEATVVMVDAAKELLKE